MPEILLDSLGLEDRQVSERTGFFSLGDGSWDPGTGGGIAVRTEFHLNNLGQLDRLWTNYLAYQPNGTWVVTNLVELKSASVGEMQKIQKLSFLNRPLDVSEQGSVSRVLGFLQSLHVDIRHGDMPDIGKTISDFQLQTNLGEKLVLPGLSLKGGFDFRPALALYGNNSQPTFNIPAAFAQELLGLGRNDLDLNRVLDAPIEKTGFDHQNGSAYRYLFSRTGMPHQEILEGKIVPFTQEKPEKKATQLYTFQINLSASLCTVERFFLLGEDSLKCSSEQRQRRLGIINAVNRDSRRHKYPSTASHLARFNEQALLDRPILSQDVSDQVRMIVKIYSGHNAREYLPGFGGMIGGNSKGIFGQIREENGEILSKGFRVDAGLTFTKQGGIQAGEHGSWDRVLSDPGRDLEDLPHDLITHLHADHMQQIIDEARCGLQVGRTVHAASYDIRVLEQFLKKERVPRDQWPTLDPLDGEGWIHIYEEGRRILSAFYSTNAIPHSTPVTAYLIVPPPYQMKPDGSTEDNSNYWSYATLGDMSFGSYNLPNYTGNVPPDKGFNPDFFSRFKESLKSEYPDLSVLAKKKIRHINVVECEPTSVHREGFAPDVVSFEKNLTKLAASWFPEMGLIMASLSTAKREHEAVFRIATHSSRHVSGEGAFLENRLTDMNIMGVNTNVLPCNPDGGNINAYLEWYAAKKGLLPITFQRRTAREWREIVVNHPERTLILATGSQGSEIEQDSVGTQIAEGWSRFQMDPHYCRSAYGADLSKFIIIYAQSAIPGNEQKQLEQIKKTAFENDLIVGVSVHDGARFYNLKEPYLTRIKDDFDRAGSSYTVEPAGGLFLHGFSLYPPGHGWKEDWRQGFLPWFKKNGVDYISVQHFPRVESAHILHALAEEAGLKHPLDPFPNHVVWTLKDGKIKTIAQFTPSFVLARDNRRYGRYFGGTTDYLRAIFPPSEGGLTNSGFFAADNDVYFNKFGRADYEDALYEATKPSLKSRKDPDRGMIEMPPSLGASRINPVCPMASPKTINNHLHLAVNL